MGMSKIVKQVQQLDVQDSKGKMKKGAQMGEISKGCLEKILGYLEYRQLVKSSCTCKLWYDVTNQVIQGKEKVYLHPWKGMDILKDRHYESMFKRLDNLSELDISLELGHSEEGWSLPPGLLKAIPEHCPSLKKLDATDVMWKVKPAVSFFSRLPNLTELCLLSCKFANPKPILDTIFSNCPCLTELDICCTNITGKSLISNSVTAIKNLKVANSEDELDDLEPSQIMSQIHKMCPDLEVLEVSDLLGGFESDSSAMCLLKTFTNRNDGQYLEEDGPLVPFAPNLEKLDLTENYFGSDFLLQLPKSYPKLKSLNLNGSTIYDAATLFARSNSFDQILSSINQLEELRFCHITKDPTTPEEMRRANQPASAKEWVTHPQFSGRILQSCVKSISLHLKHLKVLEVSEYPDLSNKHVVELIVDLPKLEKLKIQRCPKIDKQLFKLLISHPKYVERAQKLAIHVRKTAMTKDIAIPKMIKVNFEEDLMEDYENLMDGTFDTDSDSDFSVESDCSDADCSDADFSGDSDCKGDSVCKSDSDDFSDVDDGDFFGVE